MYILLFFFLLVPFLFFLFLVRGKINWRNFFAVLVLFTIYPTFALTGRGYLVTIPLAVFFVLVRRGWKLQDEGAELRNTGGPTDGGLMG